MKYDNSKISTDTISGGCKAGHHTGQKGRPCTGKRRGFDGNLEKCECVCHNKRRGKKK